MKVSLLLVGDPQACPICGSGRCEIETVRRRDGSQTCTRATCLDCGVDILHVRDWLEKLAARPVQHAPPKQE